MDRESTEPGFKHQPWDFPGGPVVSTQHFHCCGSGLIPGQGTKIPQTMRHGQKTKQNEKNTSLAIQQLSKDERPQSQAFQSQWGS